MKTFLTAIVLGVAIVLPSVSVAAGGAVGVVNFARLQTEAPQSIKAREKIDAEFVSRQAKIEEHAAQIAQLEQELKESSDIGEMERKSLQRDIRSRNLRLENAKEELQNDRRLRASEESDRLRRIVGEVIAEVAGKEGVDVVLEVGVVTWASTRADITDRVLARMQELANMTK
ncbi:MAG: OmpH family outer membrane protein [Gammaproteobacteria bacterium]|nr:OmpH family outer membrane protein [Gammaproteobacteria bacterium]